MKTHFKALTIAGSDSGGGAGIQADLKTFSALGCYGMSVITALTAQNTMEVTAIHPVPELFVTRQINAVMRDIGADSIKIGMLHSPGVIKAVADALKGHDCGPIVLDPVMVAKSGDKLLRDDAVKALKDHLIPMASVITPNLPEASVLLGRDIETLDQMPGACEELSFLGCNTILLKGGHLKGQKSTDFLFIRSRELTLKLEQKRIDTNNSHGTGCTISSAIAAFLAQGDLVETAVRKAKAYISGALEAGAGFKTGRGHGPVHHFYDLWDDK